jgi:hypothetical protein
MPPRIAATGPVHRRITPPPEARRDDWLSLPAKEHCRPDDGHDGNDDEGADENAAADLFERFQEGKARVRGDPRVHRCEKHWCSVRCVPWSEQMSSRVSWKLAAAKRHDLFVNMSAEP